MIRSAAASKPKHQSHLHQLKASAEQWRGSENAKRRPPQHVRDEAVAAVRAGMPQADVAAAIGMAVWTVSRWVSTAEPEAAVRELTLVAAPPSSPMSGVAGGGASSAMSVRFPNGICLDVPVAALTADFIGQLMVAGGVP